MQEQAAPPRFRGLYPNLIPIPTSYVPHDTFLRHAFKQLDIDLAGDTVNALVPKLVMSIRDPEIAQLAGPDLGNFDGIDCKSISCTCQDKPRYMQLFNSTSADRDSIIYNPCKRTLFAAAKRQIKSAPVPDPVVAADFVGWAKQTVDKLIGDDLAAFGYSFNQWYNHLTYAKQQRMDAIQEFISGHDTHKDHYVSLDTIDPRKFHYEAICKMEVQGTDGKPRMVCSIPDLIKYVMGPVCWKLEELFAQKIPTYCGGQNLQQMQDKINHYIDDGFVVVAEGDGSAFDNTQDVCLKEIDRYIYRKISDRVHHVPKELFLYVANAYYKIMDVISVTGKKREILFTYAVLGTVFSGDCDTTLMNTLRMGLYNWYTNYKAGLQLDTHFKCFSKGDDFTVMYRQTVDLDVVRYYYKKYWLGKPKPNGPAYDGCDERIYGIGQILKFIEFGMPNTIKFCSLRAWYIDHSSLHIYLTRDPAKFTGLAKYSRKALHMSDTALHDYLIDQAVSLETTCRGIHYFDDMAVAYRKVAAYYEGGSSKNGRRNRERDSRRTLDLEVPDPYNGYRYDHREVDYKIVGSYWQTMKQIWLENNTKLTPSQLAIVNAQIDSEFADRPIWLLSA